MLSDLEVILTVLVSIFGTATVLLIIYIVLTKCCPRCLRGEPPGFLPTTIAQPSLAGIYACGNNVVEQPEQQPQPVPQQVSDTVLDENAEEPTEQEGQRSSGELDVLPPLLSTSNKPHYSGRYNKRQTIDIFVPQLDMSPLLRSRNIAVAPKTTAYDNKSQILSILAATQDVYENLPWDIREPTLRDITHSIVGHPSSVVEDLIVPEIRDVQVLRLGDSPTKFVPRPQLHAEVRPKSFFDVMDGEGASSIKKTEADVSHGMFVSKSFGKNGAGGTIELYGVVLHIPPGALSTSQKICLGVLWTADHQPKLAKKEAMLCPIVSCEPHGLKLRKNAFLTIPHCAHKVETDWNLTGWCSETNTTNKPKWNKLSSVPEVSRRNVKLTLDHFTLYATSGEAETMVAAKWVELIAFAPLLTGKQLPIRVYCLNDYTDDEARDTKKMNKSETKQKGKEVTSPMPIQFRNDGKDLCLDVDTISASWTLSSVCSSKQEIPFEHIWHALGPSSKFVLKSEMKPSKVECSILGYQVDHADHKQKLIISEERQAVDDRRINLVKIQEVFPDNLPDVLMKMLDPDIALNNNWVALAEKMELPARDIHWLMDDCQKSESRSPTTYLLNEWSKRDKTLTEFETAMKEIERFDVLDEIHMWRSKQ